MSLLKGIIEQVIEAAHNTIGITPEDSFFFGNIVGASYMAGIKDALAVVDEIELPEKDEEIPNEMYEYMVQSKENSIKILTKTILMVQKKTKEGIVKKSQEALNGIDLHGE